MTTVGTVLRYTSGDELPDEAVASVIVAVWVGGGVPVVELPAQDGARGETVSCRRGHMGGLTHERTLR